jgi:hypothetical protein
MRKELEVIAQLWADQILNGSWDNGDATGNLLGSMLRDVQTKPTIEQIDSFKSALVDELEKANNGNINLGVDYHPDSELRAACEKSGVSKELLPVKSVTFAEPGKVRYKFGYGQPFQELIVN